MTKERATCNLQLKPRATWKLCVNVIPVVDGERRPPLLQCDSFHEHAAKMPMSLDKWLGDIPELEVGRDAVQHTYRQSVLDLGALCVRPRERAPPRARAARKVDVEERGLPRPLRGP